MDPCRDWRESKDGEAGSEEAEGNKEVADMKHKNETVAPGSFASPPRQPDRVQPCRKNQSRSCRPRSGDDDPGKERGRRRCDRDEIEPAGRRWKRTWIFAREPVARKAWDNAAPDQHDQSEHGGEADSDAIVSLSFNQSLDVKDHITHQENAQHGQYADVVILSAVA